MTLAGKEDGDAARTSARDGGIAADMAVAGKAEDSQLPPHNHPDTPPTSSCQEGTATSDQATPSGRHGSAIGPYRMGRVTVAPYQRASRKSGNEPIGPAGRTSLRETAHDITATDPGVCGPPSPTATHGQDGALPPPDPNPSSRPQQWSAKGSVMFGLAGILLLLVGFGGWAGTARISGAVIAGGQIVAEQRQQVVQHPDGGVIRDILIREGETVRKGQPLLRLDNTLLRTEQVIVESQYFEILARRGRLEAERSDGATPLFPDELIRAARPDAELRKLMEGQAALFRARRATLAQALDRQQQQIDQIRAQIDGINAQTSALTRQRVLIGEELDNARELLGKGLVPAPRVFTLERDAAGLDGRLGELASARAQAEAKITEIGIEHLRQTAALRENAEAELRDIGYREMELSERRRSLQERIARLEIQAPVSGIVHQLKVTTPDSVIRPAETLMLLVPQDQPLLVAAHIAAIDIDKVRPGQAVSLRFPGASSRSTPVINGVLERIAADTVSDEITHRAYYPADVAIPQTERDRLRDLPLIPGMPVEVYIQTEARSPMHYLLSPLSDYFSHAMREP